MAELSVAKTRVLGLCLSCEACSAICPTGAVDMVFESGQFLPYVDEGKCSQCGLCIDCCPGLSMDKLVTRQGTIVPEALCGPVLGSYTTYLRDLDIRVNSTSGGVVTGLILELLRRGQYDAAFVLPFDTFDDHAVRLVATDQPDEIIGAAKSKYVPASIYNVITSLLENQSNRRYIVVATPCQLRAIKRATALKAVSTESHLFLGLFCDRTMNFNFLHYMEDRFRTHGESIVRFEFRTKEESGHPGNCQAVFDSGRTLFIDKQERITVKNRFQLERCLYCLDKLNVDADISFGDCYVKGKADFWGRSSVIVRTPAGKRAFEQCRAILSVEEEPISSIRDSQDLAGRLTNLEYARIMMHNAGLWEDAVANCSPSAPASRRLALMRKQIQWGRTYGSGRKSTRFILRPAIGHGVARAKATLATARSFLPSLAYLAECALQGTFRRRSSGRARKQGHVIVLGAELTNKGSQAMLFTVVDQVRKRFPDREIYMLSRFPARVRGEDLYRFFVRPWDYHTQVRVTSRLARLVTRNRQYSQVEGELARIIRDAGCFIDISGFALSTHWGRSYYHPLFAYMLNILIARKNSVPFYVFPQSMGPFDYPLWARLLLYPLMKIAFSYPAKFYLRERECLQHVYPFTRKNVELSPDIVLQGDSYDLGNIYREMPVTTKLTVPAGAVALLPSARVFERTDEGKLYAIYSAIIKELLAAGRTVYIIRHSDEDLDVCTRIRSLFFDDGRVELLTKDASCIELEEVLAQFDFVIASRYHALVHAYKNAVPALVIGWSYKYPSLMAEFDQSAYYFDCRNDLSVGEVTMALHRLMANHRSDKQTLLDKMVLVRQGNVFHSLKC